MFAFGCAMFPLLNYNSTFEIKIKITTKCQPRLAVDFRIKIVC